jgi:hypothetical protein
MSVYNPDAWIMVKLIPTDESKQPHYRIFATWRGSYLTGDSWKMNSGVTEVKDKGEYYEFYGSSGSVYECHKKLYGMSAYSSSVLARLTRDATETLSIEQLDADADFMNLDYN